MQAFHKITGAMYLLPRYYFLDGWEAFFLVTGFLMIACRNVVSLVSVISRESR